MRDLFLVRRDNAGMHSTECGAGRISGADRSGDNLRIYRAYPRISDHCRITIRVRVRIRVRGGVVDCCIQTAGQSY